ncbi:MAG TPA: hypothetical protein VM600_04685 [Actinomycetota bacterium]|nr:hypothetical protein [Actinomycetota bacterium]
MKKIVVALCVVAVLLPVHAASAAGIRTIRSAELTYREPVPCSLMCPAPEDACGGQDLALSYGDKIVRAPRGSDHLVFKAYPQTDWDIVVCTTGGKLLRWSFNGPWKTETIVMRVRPGTRYVLRAYNWLDAADLRVTYAFVDAV